MGGVKVASLYAALGLDKKDYDKGLDDAESRSRSWGGKIGGIFKSAGKVIAVGLAVGLAAIAAIGAASLQNAEDQEFANARVEAVFGNLSDTVNGWASHMSRKIGVADDVLQDSQAKYAQFATNSGQSLQEAMGNGQALITRAEEIARSTGQSFDEVFEKLMKGVQGSTRGLKEFGVQAGPTTIEHEALRLGLIKEGEALDDNARTLALQSLIMQQTANYTGSAAEATDSFAFKQRQMGVLIDEVMDTIGVLFLNLATVIMPVLVDAFAGLNDWVMANLPTIEAVFTTATEVVGAALSWIAENIIPPLMAVIVGMVEWITSNWPAISATAEGVFSIVGDAIDFVTKNIIPPLMKIVQAVVAWIAANMPTISSVAGQVFGAVSNVIKSVWPVIERVATVLFPIVGAAASVLFKAIDTAFKLIGGVFEVGGNVARAVADAITGAFRGLSGFFKGVWDGISGVFRGGLNFLVDIVNGFLRWLNGLRIDIPRVNVPGTDIGIGGGSIDPFNFPLIPRFARGGWMTGDGLAWVGEHGPELVALPGGSRVHNAADSRAMAGRVEVVLRDPDRAIARGGYSQSEIERFLEHALSSLSGGLRHRSLRMGDA